MLQSLGYHRRMPRRKLSRRPDNRPRRVLWAICTSHWRMSGRGCCEPMNPHSLLQALAINLGHPGRQEKSITRIVLTKFSTRACRQRWFGVDFVGALSLNWCFVPGRTILDSAAYVTTVMEPHLVPLWHRCCEEYGWRMAHQTTGGIPKNTRS